MDTKSCVVVNQNLLRRSSIIVNADVVDEAVEIGGSVDYFANINSISIDIDWEGSRGLTPDTIHVISVADFSDMFPEASASWFDP